MKRIFIFIFSLTLFSLMSWSQSSDCITKMLKSDKVTYGQFCYFTALQSSIISEEASDEDAFEAVKNTGLLSENCHSGDYITIQDAAYLCANAWNIEGSLLYKIFPSPRYALKMLKAKRIIPSSSDPQKNISGRTALNILFKCTEIQEGE